MVCKQLQEISNREQRRHRNSVVGQLLAFVFPCGVFLSDVAKKNLETQKKNDFKGDICR